jgi:hypothetical protein
MVAVDLTGTREGNSTAHGQSRRSRYLEVAPDVSIPRRAQDRYVAKNAFASATEATDNVAWPLLKNRVLTSSVNTRPPLAGCLLTSRRKGDPH